MKSDQKKQDFKISLLYVLGIFGLLVFFYPKLFLGLEGPLVSDHYEQHYPWAYYLAHSLKQGVLPLWMPYMQSGFPIAAESQIGIFYLPNIVLSLLLPIHYAYSYTLIFHFLISGIFTFLFLRKSKINHYGAFVGACIFLFGTSYGGAYYNITSLKTICWLPVLLYALEGYVSNKRKRYLFLIVIAVGQSLVAGYLQVAALMLFFFLIYSVLRCLSYIKIAQLKIVDAIRFLIPIVLAGVVGVLFASLQILLTYPLAVLSNRAETSEAYAYIGSLSPFAFSTMILPHLQGLFRGNCLYGGLLMVYFLIISVSTKKEAEMRVFYRRWVILAFVATFLALGQWSPLYVAFIKMTHFYSFRTPAKFLIFINFSVAILSAIGAHVLYEWVKQGEFSKISALFKKYAGLLISGFALSFLAFLTSYYFGDLLKHLGCWMMETLFYGKPGRPHDLATYYAKVDSFITFIVGLLNPKNPYFFVTSAFAVLSLMATGFSKCFKRFFPLILFSILILDLYTFSFKDIKTDFAPYAQALKLTPMQQKLIELKKSNQLGRLYGYRSKDASLDLVPSINLLYNIEDVGGYSPLIMKRYHESIGLLGNVNDSNFSYSPDQDYVLRRLPLLSAMGVTHILAAAPFQSEKLKLVLSEPKTEQWLYQILDQNNKYGIFFVGDVSVTDGWPSLKKNLMSEGFDPRKTLLLEREEFEKIPSFKNLKGEEISASIIKSFEGEQGSRYTVKIDDPAFFVRMISTYKGWRVYINGQRSTILNAYGEFQAIYLPTAGQYDVEFRYEFWEAIWF